MGFCMNSTPEMGEYEVEVRRESFYLRGEYNGHSDEDYERSKPEKPYVERRHGIGVCENGDTDQGTVEILLEDIPKVRAALDAIEQHLEEARGPNLEDIVATARAKE